LSLIENLPEDILRSVTGGKISTYAATRVLVPLARANNEHARKLVEHIGHNPLSTRELSEFFKHYEGSNKQTGERMIADPGLFIKARKAGEDKKAAQALGKVRKGAGSRIGKLSKP
jgi:Glu-tRNA(Gln) amidotransferase subunit E-like FAD-binding protein